MLSGRLCCLEKHRKLPRWGMGQSPGRQRFLLNFCLDIIMLEALRMSYLDSLQALSILVLF